MAFTGQLTHVPMNDQSAASLLDRFAAMLSSMLAAAPGVNGIVIAFSGGMDSTVLLDLCVRLKSDPAFFSLPSFRIDRLRWRVLHVNHGLNPDADHWQQHCLAVCESHALSCQTFSLNLAEQRHDVAGEGIEALARQQRYRVMAESMADDEVLLTAHHAQDQGETVLFRLLRGAGPRGLSGMRAMATIPESRKLPLWRPLLGEEPVGLQRYAQQRQLPWIEDSSNQDTAFSRNYLRHQVIPVIANRWPGWLASVERSADVCRESDALLQSLAEQWLVECQGAQPGQLSMTQLLAKSPAERDVTLRQWLWRQGGQWAGQTVLESLAALLTAAEDRQPELTWQGYTIRRYRDELLLTAPLPDIPRPPAGGYPWSCHDAGQDHEGRPELCLPGNGRMVMAPAGPGEGMALPNTTCHVQYRQAGIKVRLPGRPGKSLKQLWQEAGMPPWLRDRAPLLYVNNRLAWVAGVGVCEGFRVAADEPGWLPCWQRPDPWVEP